MKKEQNTIYQKYSKYIAKILFGFWIFVLFFSSFSFAKTLWIKYNDNYSDYVNPNIGDVVNTDWIDDPLRDGASNIVDSGNSGVEGIIGSDSTITTHQDATKRALSLIQNGLNWAIWLLWFVALIYLIYHGFLIVTAAGDEEKVKKGWKWLQIAATAIAGIGLSWMFVSLIFWLIDQFT